MAFSCNNIDGQQQSFTECTFKFSIEAAVTEIFEHWKLFGASESECVHFQLQPCAPVFISQ